MLCDTCIFGDNKKEKCPYQNLESEEQANSPLHMRYCNLYSPKDTRFICPWVNEENKKKLPIGEDPCMFCADPNCPKRMKVYM